MSSLLDQIVQREKAIEDSLAQLKNQQAAIDSARADSVRQVQNQLSRDSLKTAINKRQINKAKIKNTNGLSVKFKESDSKARMHDDILDIVGNIAQLEANTNVRADFERLHILRNDITNIHKPFTSAPASTAALSGKFMTTDFKLIDKQLERGVKFRFFGANSMDKMWYYGDDELNLYNLTASRILAQDSHIQDIVNGSYTTTEDGQTVLKDMGFIDIMDQFDLDGESTLWKNVKKYTGSRANSLRVLDIALKEKKRGNEFFFDILQGENHLTDSDERAFYDSIKNKMSQYREGMSMQVAETLQKMVNSIYSRGIIAEQKSNELIEEFKSLEKLFPKKEGNTLTMYDNKDLIKTKELQQQLTHYLDNHKLFTGEDYDLNKALNQLSLDTLMVDINKLDPSERTEALDKLISSFGGNAGQSQY